VNNATISSTATSDAAGHFATPEITHKIWMPLLPFDIYIPDSSIDVSAFGYRDQMFDLYKLPRSGSLGFNVELDLNHQ